MRVIDKTPLQDEQGNISIIARIQGTLQYGLNWYSELESQKKVIGQLDRMLDKSCVLIRNFTLPESEIVIPMVLIGPGNIYVILATPVKGHFEAKGAEWNTISGNGASTPAGRNLIDLIIKLSRAFQKYLQIQNIHISVPVESVLIASNPGAQIESIRPLVRVLRSDAINNFANAVNTATPILRPDSILALAERILSPKPPEQLAADQAEKPAARVAGESGDAFDPNALGFEFNDEEPAPAPAPQHAPQQRPAPTPKKPRGMSRNQIILLVIMALFACCMVVVTVAGTIFLLYS